MAKKKVVKKVAPKKDLKSVAGDKVEPTPEGDVMGSLLVNYYKNGLNITIKNCSPKMLMLAIEELMVKFILAQGSK